VKDEERGMGRHGSDAILKSKTSAAKVSRQGGKTCSGSAPPKADGRRGGAIPAQTKSIVRDEHRKLWGRVKKRFSNNLDKSDKEEFKFLKISADVLLDIMKGEREAWGLIDEESDECLGEAASFAEEMERLTLPFGAGAALDGEEEV